MNYVDIYESIGRNIRFIRLRYNLSLEEIASRAGISSVFLGSIERKQKKPSIDTLVKISNALKISIPKLIGPEIFRNPVSKDHHKIFEISDYLYNLPEEKLEKILKIIKNI